MASDPEGNSFAPMSENGISTNYKYDHTQYRDSCVGLDQLTEELEEEGYGEEDLMEDGVPCVVLWP
jgi:hypothetical protein